MPVPSVSLHPPCILPLPSLPPSLPAPCWNVRIYLFGLTLPLSRVLLQKAWAWLVPPRVLAPPAGIFHLTQRHRFIFASVCSSTQTQDLSIYLSIFIHSVFFFFSRLSSLIYVSLSHTYPSLSFSPLSFLSLSLLLARIYY